MMAAVIATIFLIFGGLNWALVGIFDWNMVTAIFGYSLFTRIFYVVLGLAALYMIFYMIMQILRHANVKEHRSSEKDNSSKKKNVTDKV